MHVCKNVLNTLTVDKILGLSKLKAFADDKSNVTQNIDDVFHRIEKKKMLVTSKRLFAPVR